MPQYDPNQGWNRGSQPNPYPYDAQPGEYPTGNYPQSQQPITLDRPKLQVIIGSVLGGAIIFVALYNLVINCVLLPVTYRQFDAASYGCQDSAFSIAAPANWPQWETDPRNIMRDTVPFTRILPIPGFTSKYQAVVDSHLAKDVPDCSARDDNGELVFNGNFNSVEAKGGYGAIFAESDIIGPIKAPSTPQQGVTIGNNQINAPIPSLLTLHSQGESCTAPGYSHYIELPMQPFTCPFGRGYYSEFTGDLLSADLIGTKGSMHGYRATVLNGNEVVEVVAVCTKWGWVGRRGMFMQVLKSVDHAKGPSQ